MNAPAASHHELLEQWHAGTLGDTGRAELLRRLREDPVLAAEARQAAHLHLLLAAWFGKDQGRLSESVDILLDGRSPGGREQLLSAVERRLSRPAPAVRWRWRPVLLVAASLAGVLLAWRMLLPEPAVRDGQGHALANGDALGGDAVTVVRWRDGSSARLGVGTLARLADEGHGKRVVLERGQLAAQVSPQERGGFAVAAPHGEITVLGTGFRVMSVPRATTVVVDHGRVRVRAGGGDEVLERGQVARLGAGGVTRLPALDDAALRLVAEHPPRLAWGDRRPIGMFVLGWRQSSGPGNPNGWFNDAALDLRTAAGQEDFRRRLLELVDRVIVELRGIDAQGVVWWNPEGNRWLSRIGYLGDAARIATLAPEIDALADEVMRRFAAAGLRTGVVVRPWTLEGDGERLALRADPARARELLEQRVAYAERRWGCTLFPVMQAWNESAGARVPLADLSAVAAAHPRALLVADMPPVAPAERAVVAVSRSSRDLRSGPLIDPHALLYPGSPALIHIEHQPQDEERHALLGQAVGEGAIILMPVGGDPDPRWRPVLKRLAQERP